MLVIGMFPVTDKRDQLEAQLAAASTQKDKIDALNALSNEVGEDDLEYAFQLSTQAYQLCLKGDFANHHYYVGMVDSLIMIVSYQLEHAGQYNEAMNAASQALAVAKTDGYILGQIRAIYQLGLIHHRIGNYPHALDSYLEVLSLSHRHGERFQHAQALRALSRLYSATENHELALEYVLKAVDIFEALGEKHFYALLLNNTCMTYVYLGAYEQALDYGFKSLKLFKSLDSWSGQSAVEDSLSQCYAAMGDHDKAIEFALSSLEKIKEVGQKSRDALALLNVGRIFLGAQKLDEAESYLQQALNISEELGAKPRIYECHQELSRLNELRGDYEQSLAHHKSYLDIYREVVNEQSYQKLKFLEVVHRTEQAQAEAEAQRQLREQERQYFERLSQMRDQLISSTSHDLKNPLGAIVNYVYLLNAHRRTDDDKGQHYLQRIEAQVEQMRDLIGDLLDLARLEIEHVLECQDVLIRPFIEQIISDFHPQASKKDIRLDTVILPQDLTVSIDVRQMQRVMNNLMSNAIKFTPSGGSVRAVVVRDGMDITIKVEDSGIGIPEDDIPHVFDRFYRVDSEAHANIEGTGLGLAIVKSIVEQHGGTIQVTSESHKGTTFLIRLPANNATSIA